MAQQTYLVATCNNCSAVVNILEELARDVVLQKLTHKIDCCRHPVYRWDKEFHFGGFGGGYTGVLLGTTGMGLMESVTGTAVSFGTPEPVPSGASGGTVFIGILGSGLWSPVSSVVVSTSGNIAFSPHTGVSSAHTPMNTQQPMESRADVLKVELDDSLEDLVDEKKERMERVIQGVVQGFW